MKLTVLTVILFSCFCASAQKTNSTTSFFLQELNQQIDLAVVEKDVSFLNRHYADDFVFTHGTGTVDSKESWLRAVKENSYVSRVNDSTKVEIHGTIAIVVGRLLVSRREKTGDVKYGLHYLRVFRKESSDWQLISHRTLDEWHF